MTPELQEKRNKVLHFLQEYVSALQATKPDDFDDPEERERAEKALFAIDPDNPLIREFAERQMNVFEITLRESGINYIPRETKPMFEFPTIDNVNANCRFAGKCVLFTGFYPEEKAQLAPIIDFLQIEQPAGVCRKLDFLICGSNAGPAKIKKAEALEKPIIQAADFIQEISGSTPDAQTQDLPPDDFEQDFLQ